MSDQYLWDGSGEPDGDILELERKLEVLRYQPREFVAPEPRRSAQWFMAVAALLILAIGIGLLFWLNRSRTQTPPKLQADNHSETTVPSTILPHITAPPQFSTPGDAKSGGTTREVVAKAKISRPRVVPKMPDEKMMDQSTGNFAAAFLSAASVEDETAQHIEKAELLLRSVKNSINGDRLLGADLSFDKRQSRQILNRNILLRRAAAARGNVPLEQVLGSLEPLLLDIANLPDNPSPGDVAMIGHRIRSGEIIPTLQAYSMQPSEGGQ